jgi:cytochrome c peroxidase
MCNKIIFIGFIFLWAACQKTAPPTVSIETDDYILTPPTGFPQPDVPADNALTKSRIALGKRLFFDPILSRDSSSSCASCHAPYLAFSDSTATSLGVENRLGSRNSPSLANVAYQKKLMREGAVSTLEMQVSVPIQEHNEFDFNMLLAVERLKNRSDYVAAAQKAYERAPDAFVLTRAIAAYERTLISGNAPFDKWFFQNQNTALSASAKNGYALFNSEKLNCGKCHEGFLFTNQTFANNGLYADYPDLGRFKLTGLASDKAVFKVPSLRNIALTAPYMHDGHLKKLDDVINHYQTGGQPHPNKNPLLKPFILTPQERVDLLAFLNSLTDVEFIDKNKN